MPDYSDDEIDKVSDDVSESDEVLIDGKPAKKPFGGDKDIDNVIFSVFLVKILFSHFF
jgi:hypothetical protein